MQLSYLQPYGFKLLEWPEKTGVEHKTVSPCMSLRSHWKQSLHNTSPFLVQHVLSDDASELPGASTDYLNWWLHTVILTKSKNFEHDVDSSQSVDHFEPDDSDNDTGTLAGDLAQWATSNNQTLTAVNGLLIILSKHGHRLPKDARTLQTPKDVECHFKCNGQYAYYGLESGILEYLTKNLVRYSQRHRIDIRRKPEPLMIVMLL